MHNGPASAGPAAEFNLTLGFQGGEQTCTAQAVRAGSNEIGKGNIMIKSILAVLLLIGVFGSIAGCNTFDGMGKDLERAGEATSDTARDVGRKM